MAIKYKGKRGSRKISKEYSNSYAENKLTMRIQKKKKNEKAIN